MTEPNHLLTLLRWLRTRGLAHAVAGLLALITLAVPLEAAFRSTNHFGLVDPQYRITSSKRGLTVGKLWTPREYIAAFDSNEAGIRGPSLASLPGEKHRVLLGGDSFVEGRQVPFVRTLGALTDSRFPSVRVVAYRVGNHPFDERRDRVLETLEKHFDGSDGRPRADGVVFSLREWSLQKRRTNRSRIQKALFEGTRLRRLLERYSIASIDVVGFTCARLREWAEPSPVPVDEGENVTRKRVEETIHATLDLIQSDAERLGFALGIHYIPTDYEVYARRRGVLDGWRAVDSLRAICAERSIPFEDATADVAEEGGPAPFLVHDGHPTEAGHRAMVPSLARLLERMGYARD